MSEGLKKPKPPPLRPNTPNVTTDGDSGACEQLRMLTTFMMNEFLQMTPKSIDQAFYDYGVDREPRKIRELYDNIIYTINTTPNALQGRIQLQGVKLTRMGNIFNAYSGFAPEERAFEPPT